jgi:hypothetical protein
MRQKANCTRENFFFFFFYKKGPAVTHTVAIIGSNDVIVPAEIAIRIWFGTQSHRLLDVAVYRTRRKSDAAKRRKRKKRQEKVVNDLLVGPA